MYPPQLHLLTLLTTELSNHDHYADIVSFARLLPRVNFLDKPTKVPRSGVAYVGSLWLLFSPSMLCVLQVLERVLDLLWGIICHPCAPPLASLAVNEPPHVLANASSTATDALDASLESADAGEQHRTTVACEGVQQAVDLAVSLIKESQSA